MLLQSPRLLDLFCGGGGCSVGYARAGFDVVGVDIAPQKNYPFEFHQDDALEFLAEHGHTFDVIHASPVCKKYSVLANRYPDRIYPDSVGAVRTALIANGKPYIIENVPGAPLVNPLMLCGSMFGLRVYRHRLFECNLSLGLPPTPCQHKGKVSSNRHKRGAYIARTLANFDVLTVTGHDFVLADARVAMGIDWMNQADISQAIPPAYTEWIGRQLIFNIESV